MNKESVRKGMSFFKKIVDWFHDDEEDEVEAYDQEPKPQKPKNKQSKPPADIETGIETKIQYKYPKDNFKFPMISDEEIKRLNERKKKQKVEGQQMHSDGREWAPVASAIEEQPLPPLRKPLKVTRQKTVTTTVQPNKTPFRRTEIPSPIYGFQNRQAGTKKQKTVEYELSSQPTLDSVLALMRGKGADSAEKQTMSVTGPLPEDQSQEWKDERLATEEEMALIKRENQFFHEEIAADPAEKTAIPTDVLRNDEKLVEVENTNQDLAENGLFIQSAATETVEIIPEEKAIILDRTEEEKNVDLEESSVSVELSGAEQPAEEGTILEAREEEAVLEMNELSVEEAVDTAYSNLPAEEDVTAAEMPVSALSMDARETADSEESAPSMTDAVPVNGPEKEPITEKPVYDLSLAVNEAAEEKAEPVSETPVEAEQENPAQDESAAEPKLEVITSGIGEDEDRKAERARRIEERRKHIPFNVLMLKQDKARMAGRKEEKPQQTSQEPAILADKKKQNESYSYPDISILKPKMAVQEDSDWLAEQAELLDQTLEQFNVKAKVFAYYQGPSVTRFEVQPEPGVKVSKITNLSDDLKLSLAAKDIRIEAPIPGKRMIGIEIPNLRTRPVYLREVLEEDVFLQSDSPLTTAVGLDISGNPIVTDLKKMPHGLVAGSTGSGKSVFINSILVSLLYKANPSDVRLLLIDPKMVELAPYNHIPHLAAPVITDVKAATAALKWAVEEMDRRYELFAHSGARDIVRYNQKAVESGQLEHKLPYLVIIIDELADLMMMSPADVEEAICRIAQKARACGIHLLVATQRPSVDVITGLIKANIPTRIAFSVSSQVDSRTILDQGGAEKLLGRGDMLFLENGTSKTVRLQGTFVTDDEIEQVVEYVKSHAKPNYMFEPSDLLKHADVQEEKDELYFEVCEFAVEMGGASISSIQRRFRIGYNRAARLIDIMEREGVLSEARGSKPREVLISQADLEAIQDSHLPY
ncbi:DNA translocase FtsK [Gracilibacillus sp. Marseille-QA3620]